MTDTIETLQARISTLEAAAEKMAGALEQYELAISEASKDYEKVYQVAKQHGLMATAREADETAAYLYAMLKARKSALQEWQKIKEGK